MYRNHRTKAPLPNSFIPSQQRLDSRKISGVGEKRSSMDSRDTVETQRFDRKRKWGGAKRDDARVREWWIWKRWEMTGPSGQGFEIRQFNVLYFQVLRVKDEGAISVKYFKNEQRRGQHSMLAELACWPGSNVTAREKSYPCTGLYVVRQGEFHNILIPNRYYFLSLSTTPFSKK